MLAWTQGSVAGVVTGLFSAVGAGGVKESFTLAMPDGSVCCQLPIGTRCRLNTHLLNRRAEVFGLVGREKDGRPRKVLAVRDIIMEHCPLYGPLLEGGRDAVTQDTPEGLSVAADGSGGAAV